MARQILGATIDQQRERKRMIRMLAGWPEFFRIGGLQVADTIGHVIRDSRAAPFFLMHSANG